MVLGVYGGCSVEKWVDAPTGASILRSKNWPCQMVHGGVLDVVEGCSVKKWGSLGSKKSTKLCEE